MPLTADQRHALLLAYRKHSGRRPVTPVVIKRVLAANPDAVMCSIIETAFRDAACAAYVIAGPSKAFHMVTGGLSAMLAALAAAGRSRRVSTGRRWRITP